MSAERPRPHPTPETPAAAWDAEAIAAALASQPEATVDAVLGPGLRFRLGAVQPVELDLFPHRGVVRLTGGDLQLALFRQEAGPQLAPDGLVFPLPSQPEGRFLAVSPAGEVMLFLAPQSPPDDYPEAATTPHEPALHRGEAIISVQLAPEMPLSADPVAAEEASQYPLPPTDVTKDEEQPRIRLTAVRLGTDIRFKTLKDGRLVAEFPVAERQDGQEQPTWHNVAVFGERAAKLRADETLKKGSAVDVVGYVHTTRYTGRDGTPKTKREIYATAVIRR
jgi:hypothetical protein